MDINDNLKKLREQKHRFVERGKRANKQLEEMRLASNPEYIERYKLKKYNSYLRVDSLNKKIDEICETIEYCSCFDSEQIGPIICDLINLFEGEKFVYQSKRYYPNTKESKVKCIKLIVLNDRKQDEWYDERYVNSLVKKGNAIVLTKAETFYPHLDIYFYAYDELHRVNQNISFGAFPYVKEFIDGVIQYKMNNKEQKYISTEELKKLEIEFIKSRLEQIKKNYEFTDDRRTEAFLLSLEHNKIVRNRQLQKALNRYNSNENQN